MKSSLFWVFIVASLTISYLASRLIGNEYYFFAFFSILQLAALSTAWNIMGGFCGYINFGTPGFLALGAYTGMIIGQFGGLPLPVQILGAAVVSGLLGLFTGYMTLRLKGIFFAIATLAISVILETVVNNLDFVGGARGMVVYRPDSVAFFSNYNRFLFFVMACIVVIGVVIARYVQVSWIGRGLRAIRDNEEAAEGLGVPTLNLKLLAAGVSGALMGAAGAPSPLFMSFIEPSSLFNMNFAVLAMAMPLVGGTSHWAGPIIGALILGVLQQTISVTISSEVNVLLIGVVLVLTVILAPRGLLGFFPSRPERHQIDKERSVGPVPTQ